MINVLVMLGKVAVGYNSLPWQEAMEGLTTHTRYSWGDENALREEHDESCPGVVEGTKFICAERRILVEICSLVVPSLQAMTAGHLCILYLPALIPKRSKNNQNISVSRWAVCHIYYPGVRVSLISLRLMAGISKHFHFRQEALENIANGWSLALNGAGLFCREHLVLAMVTCHSIGVCLGELLISRMQAQLRNDI